jgi:hypothetical protein
MSKKSIIGFRKVKCILWAVTNLDEAVDLYVELLGGEVIYEYRLGKVQKARVRESGPDYWTATNGCLGVESYSMAMLKLPDGFKIGLYVYNVERTFDKNVLSFRRNAEVNSLSIEVDNIEVASKRLMALGFSVFEVFESFGSLADCFKYRCFLDPWGNVFRIFVGE